MKIAASYTEATDEFIAAQDWLGPTDMPALVTLRSLAEALDGLEVPQPAMVAQYGLAYRSLLKRKPSESPAEDEFERLLSEGSGECTVY